MYISWFLQYSYYSNYSSIWWLSTVVAKKRKTTFSFTNKVVLRFLATTVFYIRGWTIPTRIGNPRCDTFFFFTGLLYIKMEMWENLQEYWMEKKYKCSSVSQNHFLLYALCGSNFWIDVPFWHFNEVSFSIPREMAVW